MKIDVTFEEANESFDVRFHNVSVDPKSVKSVNGITPDESGNVQVSSTCDLEQPVWGHRNLEETEEKVRYGIRTEDNDNAFYLIPLTEEEFRGMTKYELYYEAEDDLSEAGWFDETAWVSYDQEYGGLISIRENRATLRIPKKEFVQIPGEYTGIGDIASALDHIISLQEELMA